MSTEDIYDKLKESFPKEAIKELTKGGGRFSYIPISEVIARMNNVLGVEGWSVSSLDAWRDELDTDWAIAKAVVKASVNGAERTVIGYGGQKIKRTKAGDVVDLGDEFKGACSDAIKKALTQLGVGLDLSRNEEMLEWEENERAEKASDEQLSEIKKAIADLEDVRIEGFKTWWKKNIQVSLDSGKLTAYDAERILKYLSVK